MNGWGLFVFSVVVFNERNIFTSELTRFQVQLKSRHLVCVDVCDPFWENV